MTTTVVTLVDPVGTQEIAERLEVSRRTVESWRFRYDTFPDPDAIRTGTPLWSWQTIIDWAQATGRGVVV